MPPVWSCACSDTFVLFTYEVFVRDVITEFKLPEGMQEAATLEISRGDRERPEIDWNPEKKQPMIHCDCLTNGCGRVIECFLSRESSFGGSICLFQIWLREISRWSLDRSLFGDTLLWCWNAPSRRKSSAPARRLERFNCVALITQINHRLMFPREKFYYRSVWRGAFGLRHAVKLGIIDMSSQLIS